MDAAAAKTPLVVVNSPDDPDRPAKKLDHTVLGKLGTELKSTFDKYAKDRRDVETKWLQNLRQYLGVYDSEILSEIPDDRSRAYPRVTRVKCISMVSRVMDLMFPGNEKNWEVKASPSADMDPADVQEAVQMYMQENTPQGGQPPQLTNDIVQMAVQDLADQRAEMLSKLIGDQLTELGGAQDQSYVSLNRSVVSSGVLYGLGVLRGPYVREDKAVKWRVGPDGVLQPQATKRYLPQFDFLPVWDFYPDMSSKSFQTDLDGYYTRLVMSKSQLRKLGQRDDFYANVVKQYIKLNTKGDYKAQTYETQLRNIAVETDTSAGQDLDANKYEVIVWYGPVDADTLKRAGVDVPEKNMSDELDAEVWMLGNKVIKAEVSPWYKLGVDLKTVHTFVFDEDDSSPVGNGLPNVVRDSQMSICAATRMLLDNASVCCGPQVEVDRNMLLLEQDANNIEAFKVWHTDSSATGQPGQRAVNNITIDSHIDELMKLVELFMKFADMETFIGPATGGDMSKTPSEPMRTAAGASMMRGDAALPFKDIIRNFDSFTQSVVGTLVDFNRKFNPNKAKPGDYNIIPRGATSLIAKEVRGMQIDQLVATLTDDERMHVDDRKLATARFAVRDLDDMLVPEHVAKQRIAARDAESKKQRDLQNQLLAAEVRETLTGAMKDIAQAQKNQATGEAATLKAATDVVEKGIDYELGNAVESAGGMGGTSEAGGNASPLPANQGS